MRNHKIDEQNDKFSRIKKTIDRSQYNMEFASNLIDAATDDERNEGVGTNKKDAAYPLPTSENQSELFKTISLIN